MGIDRQHLYIYVFHNKMTNDHLAIKVIRRSSADADNGLNAFSGQSRSTNIVPFQMIHIVSYCAIVTLSLRRAVFTIFDFRKCRDLEIGVRDHSTSLKVVPFGRSCMVSCKCSLVTLSLKRTVFEIFDL